MCSAIGFPGLKALAAKSPHEDVCAECKEEGDLLCCDFCPSTHHLNCLDPPMLSLPSVCVHFVVGNLLLSSLPLRRLGDSDGVVLFRPYEWLLAADRFVSDDSLMVQSIPAPEGNHASW